MNKKGFTLIELLTVIVILGIIMAVSIPTIKDSYNNAKIKSEEIFINKLSRVIDDYITLSTGAFTFGNVTGTIQKCDEKGKNCYDANIYENSNTKTLNDLIESNLIGKNDLLNPNGKIACSIENEIKIYRDTDYVYCYIVDLDCVEGENDINTCEDES